MLFILAGLVCGLILGLMTNNFINISPEYSVYLLLIILAVINSIFTIFTKKNMEEFKITYCFIYIFADIIISLVLGFISEKLGLPLYLALMFAFGNNIYKNVLSLINSQINKKSI